MIKFNMLYYCCFAHPTLIMRRRFFTQLNYSPGKIEDYRLWLSYLSIKEIVFANIGTVLLLLRKHKSNLSSNSTLEDEIKVKKLALKELLSIDYSDQLVKEFIQITGKKVNSQDDLAKITNKKGLVSLFNNLIAYYQQDKSLEKCI